MGNEAVDHATQVSDLETKKGNYLALNKAEVEAIKSYAGFGSVWMNALFTTDISDVLARLQHWAKSDEVVEKRFDLYLSDPTPFENEPNYLRSGQVI